MSQFQPRIPWSGPGAMQRNATIAALSDHVVIIAAGESGGSWEMGQLCLKKKKPLFVLDIRGDEGPGNQKLIRAGARAVTRDDLASVFNHEPPATQTTLF